MQPLYASEKGNVSADDFLKALRSVGIKKGDTIFVHSDIKSFGRFMAPSGAILLQTIVDTFKDCVGDSGTVIMPTFSYSFGSTGAGLFDHKNTKSTVGSMTEFFRHQNGVIRTIQPMLSVAAWGAEAKRMTAIGKDSFGPGSIFENLHRSNATIVLLGVDFNACTFLHYVEQICNVPYRTLQTFSGTVINGEEKYADSCTYFGRPLDGTVENDMSRILPFLRQKRLIREAIVGNGTITVIHAADLFEAAKNLLEGDPSALLKTAQI